ncbi:unnamed protein product, partial [Hapterophycus canaliculatus]
MYEIEDYEDNISKHRKIMWLFSLIIFLGYLFCAGYAYNGAKTTDASFVAIFDGTDVLMTRLQEALCAKNGGGICVTGSVGEFMLGIAAALINRLESIVDFISSLSQVAAPLVWVSSNLLNATGVIDTTERAIININVSINSVNTVLTGDGNVADFTDGGAIDTLSVDILDDIEEGRDALAQAAQLTESSALEVADQLAGNNSAIVRVKYQLDSVNGNELMGDEDLRNATLSVVMDEVLQPMRELTEDIYDMQTNELPDARKAVLSYVDMAVEAVAGIIFLPGAIMFLTSLCSGIFQSSK